MTQPLVAATRSLAGFGASQGWKKYKSMVFVHTAVLSQWKNHQKVAPWGHPDKMPPTPSAESFICRAFTLSSSSNSKAEPSYNAELLVHQISFLSIRIHKSHKHKRGLKDWRWIKRFCVSDPSLPWCTEAKDAPPTDKASVHLPLHGTRANLHLAKLDGRPRGSNKLQCEFMVLPRDNHGLTRQNSVYLLGINSQQDSSPSTKQTDQISIWLYGIRFCIF